MLSRPYFVRDGYFDDVDLAFHDHILDRFGSDYGIIQSAAVSADFTFRGEAAHAAMSPWKGRDALDAVVLMDFGLAQYREHMKPTMTAHRVITQGGEQPNVVFVLTDETNGYGAKNVNDVKCNNGVSPTVKKGDTFNCEVSIDGTKRQVTVTFQDDKGTYEDGRPT